LGDRKGIELETKTWDKTIIDAHQRSAELGSSIAEGSGETDTNFGVR